MFTHSIPRQSTETKLILIIMQGLIITGNRPPINVQNILGNIVAPYGLLLDVSGQFVGAFLVKYPRTVRCTLWECITDAFCP